MRKMINGVGLLIIAALVLAVGAVVGAGASYIGYKAIKKELNKHLPSEEIVYEVEVEAVEEPAEIAVALTREGKLMRFDYPDELLDTVKKDLLYIFVIHLDEGDGTRVMFSKLVFDLPDGKMGYVDFRIRGAKSYKIDVIRMWEEEEKPEDEPKTPEPSSDPDKDEF